MWFDFLAVANQEEKGIFRSCVFAGDGIELIESDGGEAAGEGLKLAERQTLGPVPGDGSGSGADGFEILGEERMKPVLAWSSSVWVMGLARPKAESSFSNSRMARAVASSWTGLCDRPDSHAGKGGKLERA